jgi:hypothetical protein
VIHSQAVDNYHVLLNGDGLEIEIGSIGVQHRSGATEYWAWAIDIVIPIRTHQAQGRGADRADCMRKFEDAWTRFAADEANLTEFLVAKRKRR